MYLLAFLETYSRRFLPMRAKRVGGGGGRTGGHRKGHEYDMVKERSHSGNRRVITLILLGKLSNSI